MQDMIECRRQTCIHVYARQKRCSRQPWGVAGDSNKSNSSSLVCKDKDGWEGRQKSILDINKNGLEQVGASCISCNGPTR